MKGQKILALYSQNTSLAKKTDAACAKYLLMLYIRENNILNVNLIILFANTLFCFIFASTDEISGIVWVKFVFMLIFADTISTSTCFQVQKKVYFH